MGQSQMPSQTHASASVDHPLYGRIKLSKLHPNLCQRTFVQSESETQRLVEKLHKAQSHNSPFIVRILKVDVQEQDQFCSNYKSVHATLEFSPYSVTQIADVHSFLNQVVNGLLIQDYQGVDNCAFSSSKILLFPNDQYKLLDTHILTETTDFEKLYVGQITAQNWMVAPEVMRALLHNTPFNNQKAAVFSLGIITVYLLTNVHPQEAGIYNYEQLTLTNAFAQYVDLVHQTTIPKPYKQLIQSFLHMNPEIRPTLKDILYRINEQLKFQPEPPQASLALAHQVAESPSPKRQDHYLVPQNQLASFNPNYEEVKRVLSESIHRNSPAKCSPQFKDQTSNVNNSVSTLVLPGEKGPLCQSENTQRESTATAKRKTAQVKKAPVSQKLKTQEPAPKKERKIYNLENTQPKVQVQKRTNRK